MNEFGLSTDLLLGGAPIADFVFGRSDQKAMRKLYHLTSEVPEAQSSACLSARRPTLRAQIDAIELDRKARARRTANMQSSEIAGPFAQAALALSSVGLGVLPLGGSDGKVPLVRWRDWRQPPGQAFLEELIRQHPDKNIGVICGLSGVTVVDIDDRQLLLPMLELFGDTPLKTVTPSGGIHLWYRNSGESCPDLRRAEGLAVDISRYKRKRRLGGRATFGSSRR
jgi:hypothetical protein